MLRLAVSSVRAQLQMNRHDVENLLPVLTLPAQTLISLAILVHSGRIDLASYALVAALLMTVGQMGFFIGSEIIADERQGDRLELIIATPAPFVVLLLSRILVLTTIGLVGFAESWIIARVVFHVTVAIYHPWILALTVVLTVVAAAATSLITATFCCFGRTTRTVQNAIGAPLYLLSGVLVPVTYLPPFLQTISRGLFLSWSADLLRDSMRAGGVEHAVFRFAMLVLLAAAAGVLGAALLTRMLNHLRREGTMGLA